MKNLVLTYCVGYKQEIYDRFIGSLFDTGFEGDLIMFIAKSDIDKVTKYKSKYGARFDYKIAYDIPPYHPQTSRYIMYSNYLESIDIDLYDFVFICDSRDVFFQGDIFSVNLEHHDFYAFQEENKLIGQCPYNNTWVKLVCSEKTVTELQKEPIICSGTILARQKTILLYLKAFLSLLPLLKSGNTQGIDQGIHNYLVYKDLPFEVKVLTNEDNIVNTVGYGFKGVNEKGEIVNKNASVSLCVHQYDRFPKELLQKVKSKYNLLS